MEDEFQDLANEGMHREEKIEGINTSNNDQEAIRQRDLDDFTQKHRQVCMELEKKFQHNFEFEEDIMETLSSSARSSNRTSGVIESKPQLKPKLHPKPAVRTFKNVVNNQNIYANPDQKFLRSVSHPPSEDIFTSHSPAVRKYSNREENVTSTDFVAQQGYKPVPAARVKPQLTERTKIKTSVDVTIDDKDNIASHEGTSDEDICLQKTRKDFTFNKFSEKVSPEVTERILSKRSRRSKRVTISNETFIIPDNYNESSGADSLVKHFNQRHSSYETSKPVVAPRVSPEVPVMSKDSQTSNSATEDKQYCSSDGEIESRESSPIQSTKMEPPQRSIPQALKRTKINSVSSDDFLPNNNVHGEVSENYKETKKPFKPLKDKYKPEVIQRQLFNRTEPKTINSHALQSPTFGGFEENEYVNRENIDIINKTKPIAKQASKYATDFNIYKPEPVEQMDPVSPSDDSYLIRNAEMLPEQSNEKYVYFRILRELYTRIPQVQHERSKRVSIDSAISLESNSEKLNKVQCSNYRCIGEDDPVDDFPVGNDPVVDDEKENKIRKYKTEISSAIKELLQSELVYVHSLGYVIENYKSAIANRTDVKRQLKNQVESLFGDIEEIHYFHNNYLVPQLVECNEDCRKIADTFNNFAEEFCIYEVYHSNRLERQAATNIFQSFFEEIRIAIGDKLGLANHFILPTQRLIKYSQLIQRIIENLYKLEKLETDTLDLVLHINKTKFTLEALEKALKMIKTLLQRTDDLHIVDMIRNSPVELPHSYLVKAGKLDRKHKLTKIVIFTILFKNMIMFTLHKREDMSDSYYYKDHMLLSEIKTPVKIKTDSFLLETNSKEIMLKAENTFERDKWVEKINELLLEQFNLKKHSVQSNPGLQRVRSIRCLLPEIQNNPIDLRFQGRIIHRSQMTICKDKQTYIGEIFQFENIIIFASLENQHFDKILIYEDSLDTRDVYIDTTFEHSLTKFRLLSRTTDIVYVLQASSFEDKTDFIRGLPVIK